MGKRTFIQMLASILILSFLSINACASEKEYSWFCIRSGNSQPPVTDEEILISKYNACSIDRSVTDTSDKRVIYLTFDVGYENGNVKKILDAMSGEGIRGAFFLLDNVIIKNTELVKQMADEGHLVCNHTRNHVNICSLTKEDIASNLESLEKIYTEYTGRAMSRFFRFPEGKYSESALRALSELGYKSVFWSFAYEDWDNGNQMPAEKAVDKILKNTHNGAIFLFHPTSATNAEIFPTLIKAWRDMGYTFGMLEDLQQKAAVATATAAHSILYRFFS